MFHADILGERARLTPDRTALVYLPGSRADAKNSRESRFTYGELNRRACALAHSWLAMGFNKGDRIAILAGNRVEYVDAFFAAAKTGLILVPLNTRLTAHELEFIIRDAGCCAVLYEEAFAETVRSLQSSVAVPHWINLDEVAGSPAHPEPEARNCASFHVQIDGEDTLALLYTSGTTGKPKGVIIPHRMVAWNAYNTAASWQLRDTDVSPIFTPLYHAGGLAVSLTAIFLIGGTVVLYEHFDAAEVLPTIASERCTLMFGVPTIFKLLMEAPDFATTDLSSLRWCISGGAPLPLYLLECWQRRGMVFKQGYGLTEVGVNCFAMSAEDSIRKPGSIGKPMMFTEARLVTNEAGKRREAQTGEAGELWLRGSHVSKGYWNNASATAAALDAEGWFHTGDMARCDEEGFFYIAGRLKDIIISGGINIYPAEIEAELLQHPAVREAAVIGVPHETWGESPVACIVLQGSATAEEIVAFLAQRLGKYKIPKEFVFTDELPRTAYGKVLKAELHDRYRRSRAAAAGPESA